MKVDKETLQKVAHLARLNIKPGEEDQLQQDMSEILNWVEKLKEVNTEGIEPLTHMTREVNVLRADKAEETLGQDDALKNSPDHTKQFFKVPKVLKRND